jgi:hypothetical protein
VATVTVSDAHANPITGDDVAVTSSGAQHIGPVAPAAMPGTYQATIVSSTTPGTSTITATDSTPATPASGTATLTQADVSAPAIQINSPIDGGIYLVGQSIGADYSCTDIDGGVASCAGSVANGAAMDTATAGTHAFTVTATDQTGNASALTVHYAVVAAAKAGGPGDSPMPVVYVAGPLKHVGRSVMVPLGCIGGNGADCHGTLVLRMARKRKHSVALGKVVYTIKSGSVSTQRIKLTRRARNQLGAQHNITRQITISLIEAGNNHPRVNQTLPLPPH